MIWFTDTFAITSVHKSDNKPVTVINSQFLVCSVHKTIWIFDVSCVYLIMVHSPFPVLGKTCRWPNVNFGTKKKIIIPMVWLQGGDVLKKQVHSQMVLYQRRRLSLDVLLWRQSLSSQEKFHKPQSDSSRSDVKHVIVWRADRGYYDVITSVSLS